MLGFIRSALGAPGGGDENVPEELVEITREWSSVKRFFDTAIIEGTTDEHQLSYQLADLDQKLKRIVALIHCGGKLPSISSSIHQQQQHTSNSNNIISWDKFPRCTNKSALQKCKQEGMNIFALVCQHAKLNLPKGSRSVLASFMVEYLDMCETFLELDHQQQQDNNNNNNTKKQNGGTAHHGSGMVGDLLVEEKHSVCEPLVNFISKTINDVIRCRQFTQHEERREKLHYAKLIRYLCEAVANRGHTLLANVASAPPHHQAESSSSSSSSSTAAAVAMPTNTRNLADSGQLSLPWLLDLIVTFSRADDLYPVSALALDATLRGHLSLALSTSLGADMVEVRAAALVDSLLSQLGFTFVTLCRLEENTEFADHLAVCGITIRYFDSLCVFAPHVVDTAELHQRFYRFLLGTVVEMVRLPADRSFVVSMMILTSMVDACVTGSVLPSLITQAVMLQRKPIAEAFLSRLCDISPNVRSAAANFLLACIRACPTLFATLLTDDEGEEAGKKDASCCDEQEDTAKAVAVVTAALSMMMTTMQDDSTHDDSTTGSLFPKLLIKPRAAPSTASSSDLAAVRHISITNNASNNNSKGSSEQKPSVSAASSPQQQQQQQLSSSFFLCDAATAKRLFDDARRRVVLAESRRTEPCPTVAALGAPFEGMSKYFVKGLRRALTYDMQQFTTHDSSHCAILSGILCELIALPGCGAVNFLFNSSSSSGAAAANKSRDDETRNKQQQQSATTHNGVLVDSLLQQVVKHVDTRFKRMDSKARSLILDEIIMNTDGSGGSGAASSASAEGLRASSSSSSVDSALVQVQRRVPDELKSFARGAVHLVMLHAEMTQALRAKLAECELRAKDMDGDA